MSSGLNSISGIERKSRIPLVELDDRYPNKGLTRVRDDAFERYDANRSRTFKRSSQQVQTDPWPAPTTKLQRGIVETREISNMVSS